MPFTVAGIMRLLQAVGPITAALPQFAQHFQQVKSLFNEKDQDTLQQAYTELQTENSGGHARLQEMLRKAEQE